MIVQHLLVVGSIAAPENSAENLGMQRFQSTSHDLRKTGVI